MWLTIIDDSAPKGTLRIFIFRDDIDEIQTGYDPEDNDGYPTTVFKKNGDAFGVLEDEEGINAAIRDEQHRNFLFIQQ